MHDLKLPLLLSFLHVAIHRFEIVVEPGSVFVAHPMNLLKDRIQINRGRHNSTLLTTLKNRKCVVIGSLVV